MSLDELEGDVWGPPPEDATPLMSRVHALRTKPVGDLTADDIRLLVGQKFSLPTLLPKAVEFLDADPLLEATYYPGDLLAMVLQVPPEQWQENPELLAKVETMLARIPELPAELQERAAQFWRASGHGH
jgi:hypothetical protein